MLVPLAELPRPAQGLAASLPSAERTAVARVGDATPIGWAGEPSTRSW